MSFLDLLRTMERITRPPRRDEPADDEQRPDCSCGLGDGVKLREHWSSCAVWDDDQAAKLGEMEAEMDRQPRRRTAGGLGVGFMEDMALTVLNKDGTSRIIPAGEWRLVDNSTEPAERTDYLGPYEEPEHFAHTGPEAAKLADMETEMDRQVGEQPASDPLPGLDPRLTETIANLRGCNLCAGHCNKACEQSNAFEPALTPDELVAVRGLIQERYDPAARAIAAMTFWCYEHETVFGHCRHRSHDKIPTPPTNFAGAAASLADERFIQPSAGVSSFSSSSAREDKQQLPADPHTDSPAASAPGVSPSEACDIPPSSPSEGRSTSSLLLEAAVELDYYLDKFEHSITSQINGRAFIMKLRQRADVFKGVEDE